MRQYFIVFGAISVMACQPVSTPDVNEADACGAAQAQSLLGQNVAAISFARDENIRVIGPDTVVTMDHVPERLNLIFGADGRVSDAYCG